MGPPVGLVLLRGVTARHVIMEGVNINMGDTLTVAIADAPNKQRREEFALGTKIIRWLMII